MKCANLITLKDPERIKSSRALVVPCGHCGACRHNRRTEWSFRIIQELKVSKNSYFLTLTYSEENLPWTDEGPTLVKTDFQLFMKRLRKHQSQITDYKLRYYCVGEYGTKTQRPHYHAIVFNLHQNTLKDIPTIWGKGHTLAVQTNEQTIHYVTKYHLNVDKHKSKDMQRIPEFTLMSRRPGIGYNYVETNGKWNKDNDALYVVNKGYKQNIPRYYKSKIWSETDLKKLTEQRLIQLDQEYWQEDNRLYKLGITNPDAYIKESRKTYAKLVTDKSVTKDKL